MGSETVGEAVSVGELNGILSGGGFKTVKQTKKQKQAHKKWLAQLEAERQAKRARQVDEAVRTRSGRFFHFLFQTWQWKEYKKR